MVLMVLIKNPYSVPIRVDKERGWVLIVYLGIRTAKKGRDLFVCLLVL